MHFPLIRLTVFSAIRRLRGRRFHVVVCDSAQTLSTVFVLRYTLTWTRIMETVFRRTDRRDVKQCKRFFSANRPFVFVQFFYTNGTRPRVEPVNGAEHNKRFVNIVRRGMHLRARCVHKGRRRASVSPTGTRRREQIVRLSTD